MSPGQIKTLITMGFIIGFLLLLMIAIFIIWRIIEIPIKGKADILKEVEQARTELHQIQAAKGVEWDRYKDLVDEQDRTRNALILEKKKNESLKEENSKLTVHNDNLKGVNKELKKGAQKAQ